MSVWGIIPAAGEGRRIQPLACSKELLPVGCRRDRGGERPRAVCEYLLDRMVLAGVDRVCFVIAPRKGDIVEYVGELGGILAPDAALFFAVQPRPAGLCDAVFRALPLVEDGDLAVIGLPDTIWFPEDGLARLGDEDLSFLLFPVDRPEHFDSVTTDEDGRVVEIQVKQPDARSPWIWGAFKLRGSVLRALHSLWLERDRVDAYLGTLVNEYLRRGGRARGVRAGRTYLDVGTLDGLRRAQILLGGGG